MVENSIHITSNDVNLERPTVVNDSQTELNSEAITSTEQTAAIKTELASFLDGSSLKNPASVNAVVLWDCTAKHPTDLNANKGERVKILYRNGDLAFVENSQQKQGFIPLGYCSLYRRKSSSFSELFTETTRRLSGPEKTANTENTVPYQPTQCSSTCKEMASGTVKKKRFGRLISRGTYDARSAENKSKTKNDKGIFNSAAKKLVKAFTIKAKGKSYKSVQQKKPIPDWLMQLNFDNNNPDYSSSSDSSDDDEDDSAYESFRPGSETRLPDNTVSIPGYFQEQESINEQQVPRQTSQYNSQEFSTGYANVRKLRTNSTSGGNGVSRSRSFNFDTKTKMLQQVLQRRPKDLIDGSDSESEQNEDRMLATKVIKRVPSYDCIRSDSRNSSDFVGFQGDNIMVVLHDFNTADSKDLDVFKGQRVRVLNKNDNSWWMCEAENGRGGFVPRDYLAPEHGTQRTIYSDTGEEHFTFRGRNDWQDLSFRTKATSVKLARITPMTREPCLQQNSKAISAEKNIVRGAWNGTASYHSSVWTDDITELKNFTNYTRECHEEECYECIAACPACHQDQIDEKSYKIHPAKRENVLLSRDGLNTTFRELYEIDKLGNNESRAQDTEPYKESVLEGKSTPFEQYSGNSYELPNKDQLCLSTSDINNEERKQDNTENIEVHNDRKGQEKVCATVEVSDNICQLPTYDEIVERRNLKGLSEMKTRITTQLKSLHEELEQKNSGKAGHVEKLLDEWRSQQKQSSERMPPVERKTSSDSQSTISDSIDSVVPRVLRRRNSMSRRARFQNTNGLKNNERNSGCETIDIKSDTNKGQILATWL